MWLSDFLMECTHGQFDCLLRSVTHLEKERWVYCTRLLSST
jgi:hypothetical protein